MLNTPARSLSCESDIGKLHSKGEGSVTAEELKNLLRRYNLRDGLISLGQLSLFILNDQSENKIGTIAYRDPATTAIVTQFALAYLATTLITSGANDYKAKILGAGDNLLAYATYIATLWSFRKLVQINRTA